MTRELPSIAIVITSYNYAEFLGEAIDSALTQHHPARVVVVDDGSADGSAEVIRSYGADVTSVFQFNAGQAAAWNAGHRIVDSDYVVFLDSDDRLLPHATAVVANQVGLHRPSKVHWRMRMIDAAGRDRDVELPSGPLPSGDRLSTVIEYGMDPGHNMPSSGNAWSREFLDAVMPMPPQPFRLAPDTYLLGLSPLFGATLAVEQVCSQYRSHHRNNGGRGSSDQVAAGIVARCESTFDAVATELARRGVNADPERWRVHNPTYRRFRDASTRTACCD